MICNKDEGGPGDIIFSDDVKKNSAVFPNGIPAIFLISTRECIKAPIEIMLR